MDNNQFYTILAILIAGFLTLLYFMRFGRNNPQDSDSMKLMTEWMKSLRDDTFSSRKEIQDSINKSSDDLNKRLTEAARLFADVQHKVGEMSEIGRGMKDIQDLLKGPKLRGGMGEESLEMTLKQVLPDKAYQMQYRFSTGEIVDCIVRVGNEMVSIDSKFPLENFRMLVKSEAEEDQIKFRKDFLKDVKKHIDAISKKYILPNENTMDFALMYVPMESVFHEIVNDTDISDYARSKRIYITSPNSFYHYITIIMNGLKAAQINEMIKPLLRTIGSIKQDSDKFNASLSVLTKHITNAKDTSDTINEDFRKLASKIENAYALQVEDKAKFIELPEINIEQK